MWIEETLENKHCSTTLVDPKTAYIPLLDPKISQLGPQKVKSEPKLNKKKSKFTIEENIENRSCSTTWRDPKTIFEPYPEPKNSPLGLKK